MDEQTVRVPRRYDVGSATDVGRVRDHNEDAMYAVPREVADENGSEPLLVAVADGMGGHNAGEVASRIAISRLVRAMAEETAESGSEEDASHAAMLERAVLEANRAIWDEASRDTEKEGMGTTLVCAVVDASGEVVIAHVGDSRAYVVSGSNARQLTADHTWVTEQVHSGSMSEQEANRSPYRHLLTRSLGGMPDVTVEMSSPLWLGPGDALVLVSDGVTGYVDGSELSEMIGGSRSAQDAAEHLVQVAVDRGGADNATAVVVRVTV
jgi:PPM family protein phosphatase